MYNCNDQYISHHIFIIIRKVTSKCLGFRNMLTISHLNHMYHSEVFLA